MHGHSHDSVEALIERKRPDKQSAQGLDQAFYLAVFKEMNQLLQGILIAAERIDRIKVRFVLAADRTFPVFIQRVRVYIRGAADDTEVVHLQRLGKGKARKANRYTRYRALQRLPADTAIIGENKVKERRAEALNRGEPLDRR
jgi:hypothetical protein